MGNDELTSDEISRFVDLFVASKQGEIVDIEGITFNLNHADLDRTEWEPIQSLGDFPGSPLQPSISFPWTSNDDLDRLRSRSEPTSAKCGDKVFILSVEKYSAPPSSLGKLDHPHHQERRVIRLGIQRSDTDTIEVSGMWIFVGVSDVMTPIMLKDGEGVRSALISRFERMTGLENIIDNVSDFSETAWNSKFTKADREIQLAAAMLWEAEDEAPNNAAMAFGYLIGRAEGKQGRQRLAKSASKAPRKTGDPARATAIELIDGSPRIILKRCAEQVAQRLGKSARSIEDTIAILFSEDSEGVLRPDPNQVELFRTQLASRPSDANP